jgi:hypothetical protein
MSSVVIEPTEGYGPDGARRRGTPAAAIERSGSSVDADCT